MWHSRMLPEEKETRKRISNTKRQRLHPTRVELYGKVSKYCKKRKLSRKSEKRIHNLVYNIYNDIDERDLRQVPVEDRVPRSLEREMTFSEHYWEVDYFDTVKDF